MDPGMPGRERTGASGAQGAAGRRGGATPPRGRAPDVHVLCPLQTPTFTIPYFLSINANG